MDSGQPLLVMVVLENLNIEGISALNFDFIRIGTALVLHESAFLRLRVKSGNGICPTTW